MTSGSPTRNHVFRRGIIFSVIIFLLFFPFLSFVVSYIDNTTMLTANGLWKSLDVQKWYENSPDKRFMPAEILYEPTYGLLSHFLPDSLFLFQKMPIVNSFFGALALSFYFLLIYIFSSNIWVSFLGVVFHLGIAFFLGLNITSEDILPAYSLFIGSVVFFTLYAKELKLIYFFLGTQLFVLSFLFHWTVLFPALPAIMLAILFLDNNLSKIKTNFVLFFSFFMIMPLLVASFADRFINPTVKNHSFFKNLQSIFWPGKGLGTGWGGFKGEKFLLALSGVSEYLIGGQNLADLSSILATDHLRRMLLCLGILCFLGVFFSVWLYKNWGNPAHRTTGIILGTTFLCGLAMNLYTQPQDPQFVIQPLAWVPFSFAMLIVFAYSQLNTKKAFFLSPLIVVIALIPLFINFIFFFLPTKGATAKAIETLKSLEKEINPYNTVFVIHGFEPIAPWARIFWRPCVLDNFDEYRPNQCHIVFLSGESIHSPSKTPLESAEATIDRITRAFQLGNKVVANSIWEFSEQKFIDSFVSVGTTEKAREQYQALHANFEGTFLVQNGWGNFYELTLKDSIRR